MSSTVDLLIAVGLPNADGVPERLGFLKWPPGGGVRIKPTGVTSLKGLTRPMSTLALD